VQSKTAFPQSIQSPNQSQKLNIPRTRTPFDENRKRWAYTPEANRVGVAMRELLPEQRELVVGLIATALSPAGTQAVRDTMSVERRASSAASPSHATAHHSAPRNFMSTSSASPMRKAIGRGAWKAITSR